MRAVWVRASRCALAGCAAEESEHGKDRLGQLSHLTANQPRYSRPCSRPPRMRPTPYSSTGWSGSTRTGESSSTDRVR
eukprot:6174143-Pleurochrysis_carterae.AAC.1